MFPFFRRSLRELSLELDKNIINAPSNYGRVAIQNAHSFPLSLFSLPFSSLIAAIDTSAIREQKTNLMFKATSE